MPLQDNNCSNDEEENELLQKNFTSEFRKGYVTIDGFCLPEYYETFADSIASMNVFEDDIWVCSFPKAGNEYNSDIRIISLTFLTIMLIRLHSDYYTIKYYKCQILFILLSGNI